MGCRKTRWMMPKRKRSATGLQPTNPRRSCVKSVRPVIGTGVGVSNRLDLGIDCRARPGNSPLLLRYFSTLPAIPLTRFLFSPLPRAIPSPPSLSIIRANRYSMLYLSSTFISRADIFIFLEHESSLSSRIRVHFLGKFVDVRPS